MPRLLGYKERIDATLYDAFSPRDMLGGGPRVVDGKVAPYISLFGNRNIGNAALTNLQIAGQFPADKTFLIVEWYARTNVTDVCRLASGSPYRLPPPTNEPLLRAWDAWVNATTVELWIGSRPVTARPLVELCGARMFDPSGMLEIDAAVMAERMWRRGTNPPGDTHLSKAPTAAMTFGDLPQAERDGWIAAATAYPFRRPFFISVRQTFGVKLHSDRAALEALLRHLPDSIAPQPLVWVHLDGFMNREVA
jgi:hypothetical protein